MYLFDTSDHEWIWRQFLVNNNVRDDLGRILDKMIDFGTRKRYQSAREILQDLTGQSPTTSIQTPATPVIQKFHNLAEVWGKFCDCVDWTKGDNWLSYGQLTFNSAAPQGHLPAPTPVACGFEKGTGGLLSILVFSSLAQRLVTCKI